MAAPSLLLSWVPLHLQEGGEIPPQRGSAVALWVYASGVWAGVGPPKLCSSPSSRFVLGAAPAPHCCGPLRMHWAEMSSRVDIWHIIRLTSSKYI